MRTRPSGVATVSSGAGSNPGRPSFADLTSSASNRRRSSVNKSQQIRPRRQQPPEPLEKGYTLSFATGKSNRTIVTSPIAALQTSSTNSSAQRLRGALTTFPFDEDDDLDQSVSIPPQSPRIREGCLEEVSADDLSSKTQRLVVKQQPVSIQRRSSALLKQEAKDNALKSLKARTSLLPRLESFNSSKMGEVSELQQKYAELKAKREGGASPFSPVSPGPVEEEEEDSLEEEELEGSSGVSSTPSKAQLSDSQAAAAGGRETPTTTASSDETNTVKTVRLAPPPAPSLEDEKDNSKKAFIAGNTTSHAAFLAGRAPSALSRQRTRKKDVAFDAQVKLLLLGDSSVGKSSLLLRFCENKFDASHILTIGVDFKSKIIDFNEEKIKVQVWDTAGQERFRNITPVYFRNANGVILVYDVTKPETFENIKYWLNLLSNFAGDDPIKVIVGNKIDLPSRAISKKQGQALAAEFGLKHYEASAKSDLNVSKIFSETTGVIRKAQIAEGDAAEGSSGGAIGAGQIEVKASKSSTNNGYLANCCPTNLW